MTTNCELIQLIKMKVLKNMYKAIIFSVGAMNILADYF